MVARGNARFRTNRNRHRMTVGDWRFETRYSRTGIRFFSSFRLPKRQSRSRTATITVSCRISSLLVILHSNGRHSREQSEGSEYAAAVERVCRLVISERQTTTAMNVKMDPPCAISDRQC
jgi:hypothetical protein